MSSKSRCSRRGLVTGMSASHADRTVTYNVMRDRVDSENISSVLVHESSRLSSKCVLALPKLPSYTLRLCHDYCLTFVKDSVVGLWLARRGPCLLTIPKRRRFGCVLLRWKLLRGITSWRRTHLQTSSSLFVITAYLRTLLEQVVCVNSRKQQKPDQWFLSTDSGIGLVGGQLLARN